ncbi:MAG: glycosyltransferase [Blautia sp.]|nr:glycosyltransferase [Blautia sp.]MDY5030336.1 glycosyltransferase [Blautia sp.]
MEKTKNKIMVSVLMFVYNHEKYLREAIESVLCQDTEFSYEVIIHDDASTDGSAGIIEEYAVRFPERIVPILQKENQMQKGISITDKFMMPAVRGKYIAYCEGDDYWLRKDKLQKQVDFLEQHEAYAAVTHNCRVVDGCGRTKKPVKKFFPYKKPYTYTLKDLILEDRMPGQTATVMYRRRYYSDMKPAEKSAYERIRYCVGDRRRTLLILLNGPVYCMNEEMSAYRYITSYGESWNARVYGKNLAGRYYVQEMDFRKFARDYHGVRLRNDYVLFGTGIMSVIRFLKKPDKENKRQLELVLKEHESPFRFSLFLLSVFPGALLALVIRTFRKVKSV